MKLSQEVLARRVFRKDVNDRLQKETILSCLHPFVRKDKVSIDVGAATGHITYYLAPRSKTVYAFEAVEPVYRQLVKMQEFPNVKAINAAVSDFDGPGTIYVDHKRLSNSGFQDLVGGPATEVNVVQLDNTIVEPVGFIKIDVEGTELDVLQGAEALIWEHRPNLMVEIYEPFTKYPLEAVFDFLMQLGYRCFYFDQGALIPVYTPEEGVTACREKHAAHDGDFLFV